MQADEAKAIAQDTAEKLASRGCTVRQWLTFWRTFGEKVDGIKLVDSAWVGPANGKWSGALTQTTTTAEMVSKIVIPQTEERQCSYMQSAFMINVQDPPKKAMKLLSHWWGNSFYFDLLAVLEDATGLNGDDLDALVNFTDLTEVERKFPNAIDESYWFCAFAVNQHVSICGTKWNPCQCTATKHKSPDPLCEIDKFDIVMDLMHEGLVVGLDPDLNTLTRCWVLSEIAKCVDKGMKIVYYLPGKAAKAILSKPIQIRSVEKCESSDPDDKRRILDDIKTSVGFAKFDTAVRDNLLPVLRNRLLSQAAEEGETEAANRLIEESANVNYVHGGITPLWWASKNGDADVVKTLCGHGANELFLSCLFFKMLRATTSHMTAKPAREFLRRAWWMVFSILDLCAAACLSDFIDGLSLARVRMSLLDGKCYILLSPSTSFPSGDNVFPAHRHAVVVQEK